MARFRSPSLLDVLLLIGLGAACTSPPPKAPLKMEVEYAGCRFVLPGPVCVPGPDLRLWVGAPPEARIEIRAGGDRLGVAGEPVREGRRFSLTLPEGAERLDVLVETASRRGKWSLALRPPVPKTVREMPGDLMREVNDKTTRVYHDLEVRQLSAARETLDSVHLLAQAPAESRSLMTYSNGLLARAEGDYRTALAELRLAMEIAERTRMVRYRWGTEAELALTLRLVGRSRDAAEIFERLRRKLPGYLDSCDIASFLNNQGWSTLLAREAGETAADPSGLFEEALKFYGGCKKSTLEDRVNVLLNLALASLQEGRLAEAEKFLARARELEPDPPLSHTLWWRDLEARMALKEGRPKVALKGFDRLGQLARAAGSPDGRLRAALGQAQSHVALADPAAALRVLREAGTLLDRQSLQIPVDQGRETFIADRQALVGLHLQILLAQGRKADALEVARRARSRVLRQLARADRLESLEAARRTRWTHLLAEYQERRMVLEERAKDDWKLAADQLDQEQAARRAESEAVQRLLDEAFQVLGDSAEPSPEAPPPPRPGDLILAYHPLSRDRWVGFATDGKTVEVARFELPSAVLAQPRELSRRLLLPFRGPIERAKRLRILPAGSLEQVDFHALPFGGDVLLAGRPVVYGLDLPVPAGPGRPPGRHALLVADPREDLPGSLAEVRRVAQSLRSGPRPWSTEELTAAAASAPAVRGRLAAADLLHYAGHGTFSGFGGWESGLLLAGKTRLTPGDFLALDRVPAWVVLSGCDTGRASAETPVEGLGLAHAFLLSGSRAVVASTRLADDRQTPWFFAELYRQWDREPDLAVALQQAELAWRRQSPKADWAGFRLFEP